jgi:alpha-mannosidase
LIRELQAYSHVNKCPKFKNTTLIMEMVAVNLRRGRDLDNLGKVLCDAIEKSGLIDNDANLIVRPLYKTYDDTKQSYLIIRLFEPKGQPSQEDINEYFFWLKNPNILESMNKKVVSKRGTVKGIPSLE